MTKLGCCDKVDITNGTTYVMFGTHKYLVDVHYCKTCGSMKTNSHIKHIKNEES